MALPLAITPLAVFPLLISVSTYLAPSSCDRNHPPQFQVARKLPPLSPIAPSHPPLQIPNPPGFPETQCALNKGASQPSFQHATQVVARSQKMLITGSQKIADNRIPGYG